MGITKLRHVYFLFWLRLRVIINDFDIVGVAPELGWRSSLLTTVVVPGELPATLHTWTTQQFRWRKGVAEVARKMLPRLVLSHIGFSRKLMSGLQLGGALLGPMAGLILVTGVIDLTRGMGLTFGTELFGIIFALELMAAESVVLLGQYFVRRSNVIAEFLKIQLILCVLGYVHLANWRANLEAWLGYGTEFVRTPKGRKKPWMQSPEPQPLPMLAPVDD